MGNRCENCGKFVSLDVAEPEFDDPVEDNDAISIEGRIHLDCSDCGTEMKEWQVSLIESLPDEAVEHFSQLIDGKSHYLELEYDGTPDVSDSFRPKHQPKPRKDGTIPRVPFRYQVHYYRVDGSVIVRCSCGEDFGSVDFSDEIAASGFDELN